MSVESHLKALETSVHRHEIRYYNTSEDAPSYTGFEYDTAPSADLLAFDPEVVVLHNTFLGFRWTDSYFFKFKERFDWIGDLDCLKIALPQDEYDHAEILEEWLIDWGVAHVFTVHDEIIRAPLYPSLRHRASFHKCLTGYVDRHALELQGTLEPTTSRGLDICYRASHLPFWFGSVGQLKHRVGDVVGLHARDMGFRCDVSTRAEDTILGHGWLSFLGKSRSVIGCEGGSSVIEWRGESRAAIRAMLEENPDLSFDEVRARMPAGWDEHAFLAVSPRHFEAVATKTCQLLVEGSYDGVLEPDRHYISVRRDFSNLDAVLEKLRDERHVTALVDCAYDEVYRSGDYAYERFAESIDAAITQSLGDSAGRSDRRVTEQGRAVDVLEQQLIASRHERAMLEAKLRGAEVELAELRRQVAEQTDQLCAASTNGGSRHRALLLAGAVGVAALGLLSFISFLMLMAIYRGL